MRLLNVKTKHLEIQFTGSHYAIVSHRWGIESEEVLFTDICIPYRAQKKAGYYKILGSCKQALKDGLEYVWLDTCCIDKGNNTELTEAINSMYKWYQEADVCYAYLHDVTEVSDICGSEWFKRGWTLQELIAPKVLKFFNRDWEFLGTRKELVGVIESCTGVPAGILLSGDIYEDVSIAQRMFWASKRETTRVEDRAYSLLGLLGVNLQAIYGIEHGAFGELQYKIISISHDQTLFAWQLSAPADGDDDSVPWDDTGLLASSPSPYQNVYQIPLRDFYTPFGPKRASRWPYFSMKNGVVRITLPIRPTTNTDAAENSEIYEALLRCSLDPPRESHQGQRPLVVYLKYNPEDDQYVRVHTPTSLRSLEDDSMTSFKLEKVHVHETSHSVIRNPPSRARTPVTSNPSSSETLPVRSETSETVASSFPQLRTLVHANIDGPHEDPATHAVERVDQVERWGVSAGVVTTSINNTTPPNSSTYPEDPSSVLAFPRFLLKHPPGTKTINIIVCGEPGGGGGGVVNLLAGRDVVYPQAEFDCSAMTFTTHDISLDSHNVRIFYTVGPWDHLLDINGYHTAVENATKLAQALSNDGGVHLLVCCMPKTKINRTIHSLFYDVLCGRRVPMVFLITGVGRGLQIDSDLQGIPCDDHACISVVRPSTPEKREEQQRVANVVRQMLARYMDDSRQGYLPQVGPSIHLILKEFMSTSAKCALTLQISIERRQASKFISNLGMEPQV